MIKVPGHFKFFAIIISSLRFFSDSLVSSLRVRWNFSTINVSGHFKLFAIFLDSLVSSLRVQRYFSGPMELFNDKSSWSLFHYKFFASPTELFTTTKVPGFSSKSDGTFHNTSDRSF